MFDSIKSIASQMMSGNLDSATVGQAVSDHLGAVGNDQLTDHLQAAAANLQQNGQTDYAQQATALAQQVGTNPSGVRDSLVSLITNNPQILQQFLPEFAAGIASRLGL
jgi:23S rRNA G2445 N2-methylase RlmL